MAAFDEVFSNSDFGAPREDEEEEDDDANTQTINDVESLKKGIIKTSKNKASYTILLVGETGVGKSAFLEFLGNVLIGNDIDHYSFRTLDRDNEQNGSEKQSQTNSARLYELKSKNGIVVHILDTPGLADTRGIGQDELHKKDINAKIKQHIDSVTAVLILANGTVPRLTVGTDYALSTLSAIFPKSLAENIAFVFTNVPEPLAWNFSMSSVPWVLQDAPTYLLDNPIALQKRYLELKDRPGMKKVEKNVRNHLKAVERKALEMLVQLFDWLDGCKPQPTTEILYLYKMSQDIEAAITDTLAQIDQGAAKKVEIDKLMADLKNNSNVMNACANFVKTVNLLVWKQKRTPTYNMLCGQMNCYSNCHVDYKTTIPLELRSFFGGACRKCNHSLRNHHRCYAKWVEVNDTQVLVDSNMKEQYEAAKDGKEQTAAIVAASEKVLVDLDQVINRAIDSLTQLVDRYARLSLSGSFAAQVNSAVRLLEQNYLALEGKGVGPDQLQRVKENLDYMKRKPGLLINARADVFWSAEGAVDVGTPVP